MERKISQINGINIHYRQAGKGPFLFLLHPSPRSGKMMEPLMLALQSHFTTIAPDTPGYGYSDPLPQKAASLYDYLPFLGQFIHQFTTDPVDIYGSATGAQLAIALGLSHPAGIRQLWLDNCAHFTREQTDYLLPRYFPDFSPQEDGSHLPLIWQHVQDSCLFFPWFDKKEKNRIAGRLPPAEVIQSIVTDYLLAGPGYADAYRAAFMHERAENIQQLTCRATIFRWLGSPILPYIHQLLAHAFPPQIRSMDTPAGLSERFRIMQSVMAG